MAINEENVSDMAAVFEASREAHEPTSIEASRGDHDGASLLVIPDGMQVVDPLPMLDARREYPARAKGTSQHQTLDSLQAHVARHKDGDTVAWLDASATAAKLSVVYNYNCGQDTHLDTIQGQARHGDHRATYAFPLSDPWKAWQGVSGKPMGQAELAAFLESRVTEIRGPEAAGARVMDIARALVGGDDDAPDGTLDGDMLDLAARRVIASPSQLLRLARRISMHVETRATEERDAHGNVNIIFKSEATAESTGEERGRVTLPQLLVIEVPVVQGGAAYKLPVRLSTKIAGQRCAWTLTVHRADLALEDAVADAAADFTSKTGVIVYRGTPES